ncbi:MAG: dienelactone hydrolase family protein [Halorhodospira halophila]|uniref:alpha/beta hydrolase n=1 Tax=Halorhodospira TaxID=85108 RepID=UPI001914B6A5|nr:MULTISPECIES: dienelactone hydrolase family protein [Halorhodospira]MBK5943491.1 carboxylesterase [Halorhodospira halophila]MCC3750205.1 dienelactone hydrolase family protein [Halorhodospira halophila]MCG5527021.1 dienelactone hydrolase family protein [Halorhodospira halophila]MCG5532350.1 dienelactone hydrolase family protein [Halorhodospira sp. 9621]MCG5538014.1 dienelactone hydrolase family protein [Halorhodospira sp. 9622]
MNETSLLECVEKRTGENVSASIIWLHGLGADGHDFAPIVDELRQSAGYGVRLIFPHAPVQPVTVNGGMSMPAWYDIRGLGGGGIDEDTPGLERARLQIEALMRREVERGTPAERLFLAGFSQGAATALYTALNSSTPPAGVIALSGWLPSATETGHDGARAPVFMAHGTQDPIVPIELGRQAAAELEAAGHPVEWHDFPMEHAVCMPEIQRLDTWLSNRLGRS